MLSIILCKYQVVNSNFWESRHACTHVYSSFYTKFNGVCGFLQQNSLIYHFNLLLCFDNWMHCIAITFSSQTAAVHGYNIMVWSQHDAINIIKIINIIQIVPVLIRLSLG